MQCITTIIKNIFGAVYLYQVVILLRTQFNVCWTMHHCDNWRI